MLQRDDSQADAADNNQPQQANGAEHEEQNVLVGDDLDALEEQKTSKQKAAERHQEDERDDLVRQVRGNELFPGAAKVSQYLRRRCPESLLAYIVCPHDHRAALLYSLR